MKADTVKLLIDHGADVAMQDETKSTPLHLASSLGSTETVRLLIEHGADVTARDTNHRTPLHLAASLVSTETAALSIRHGLMFTNRKRGAKSIFIGERPTTKQTRCSYWFGIRQTWLHGTTPTRPLCI